MSLSGWLQRREKKRPFSSDDVALSPSDDAGIVSGVDSAAVANPGTDAVATVWGADAAAVDDPAIATGSAVVAAAAVFKYELVSVVSRVAWEMREMREKIDSAPVVVRAFISSSYYAFASTLIVLTLFLYSSVFSQSSMARSSDSSRTSFSHSWRRIPT